MYWKTQHNERKRDADLLLDVAMKIGLHIYDRSQAGGAGDAFPERYKDCIRGGLPYTEVVKMYKHYRAFLNVNIVKTSPTMFSRRVFELLACGTPVVSSYSIGIAQMFPEVLMPGNASEAEEMINKLLHDDVYWQTVSKAGARRVLRQHTYAHRLADICEHVGLPVDDNTKVRIALAQEMATND
jgi:spore maturation protein CgeB